MNRKYHGPLAGVGLLALVVAYEVGGSPQDAPASTTSSSPTSTPAQRSTPSPTPSPTLTPEPTYTYDFRNSWPDGQLHVTRCVNTGRYGKDFVVSEGIIVVVAGTITNTTEGSEDYVISFYANSNLGMGTGEVEVVRVAPEATREWSGTAVTTNAYPGKSIECGVLNLAAEPS